MSEETTNKNVTNDEIDLLDLFRKMGRTISRWANALGKAFMISLVFLLRRWLPLGLSLVAGVGLSYLLKSTSASFFTSDLVLRNNLALMNNLTHTDASGTTSELLSKIDKLHTLCLEENYAGLESVTGIDPETAKNISDISAHWIIDQGKDGIPDYVDYRDSHSAYDTTNIRMQDRLDIRVKVISDQNLNKVRDGILKFIESDSLYQQRNRVRLRQYQDLLTRYKTDIIQLDSLQKVKYFEETRNMRPASGGQIVFMQEQKTQLLYNDMSTLYARKQQIETEQALYKTIVTVLSDFPVLTRRENGAMYYGKTVIPVLFAFTVLILILIKNRNRLREIFNKY